MASLLNIRRRVRDNLHGTIDLSELEDRVIAHPYFQRLRRIRQTAFLSYVFPGATHSRFEHSLGVLHLATVAWEKLRANQLRLEETCYGIQDFASREKLPGSVCHGYLTPVFKESPQIFADSSISQSLRLAGLLHDLGHPPFSHSGEKFLPTWKQLRQECKNLPFYLSSYFDGKMQDLADRGQDPGKVRVRHEIFTVLMADKLLKDLETPLRTLSLSPQDVHSIIIPEIPPESGSSLLRLGVNGLCHELISGELDVDRMDYLLRDSRECGVVYGIFDVNRILDSIVAYAHPTTGHYHLAIQFSGLAAFEDFLRARHSMYLQLYFHKTSVAAEAMIQRIRTLLGTWHLPASVCSYSKIDEHSIGNLFRNMAQTLEQPKERQEFEEVVEDLLYHRRLWKRVYELSAADFTHEMSRALDRAQDILKTKGISFELVSSQGHLTRFAPRTGNMMSPNVLRVVKKDFDFLPRVEPIEDHSALVGHRRTITIKRLYVPNHAEHADDGDSPAKAAKALLRDAFHASKPMPIMP